MRIVFMGSSAASATCLYAITREKDLEVVGVVTQPDRPAGRGKTLQPCPCKKFAIEHDLGPVITPENVNDPDAMAQLRSWNPDAIAVVAYGQFLKEPLLKLPPFGCVNCHFSLLPKYRGASPVVAAIANGDRRSGVSIIRMGLGMDDGPILHQSYEPVYSDTTGGELMDTLAVAGGVRLAQTLAKMAKNELPPEIAQDERDATFARKLKKTDGLVRWDDPVLVIERRIRAYYPWPGVYTFLPERFRKKGNSGRVVVLRAEFTRMEESWRGARPGTVLALDKKGPVVKCGDTAILLTELKPEGGGVMNGAAFLNGRKLVPGEDSFLEA
ncbi:MAG: methionyl-tRNA formyltransferase [Kiritimatiellae bacterium]|nr:methionyl-tRNA formyltransferase [Kiritimatiellia bacterium]